MTLPLDSWLAVAVVLGTGTLLLRVGFGEWHHHLRLPAKARESLDWLPAAALAAMVMPSFTLPAQGISPWPLWLAAAASAWIGFRTRNLLLAVLCGIGLLLVLRGIIGTQS